MIRTFTIFILSLSFLVSEAQYYYDLNQNCRNAYSSVISLKFEEGKKLIDAEKRANPDNNIPYLIENYIYFLSLFIGEKESDFEYMEDLHDDIVDRLEDGDESSPYYRYSLAQVNLQWAFAGVKFKEYVSATVAVNKAYRLLEKNNEEFPSFLPNKINLGLMHTLIGTIPDKYSWIKKMVGIEGTINQGTAEILEVLDASLRDDDYSIYKAECLFYLSFIQLNLSADKKKALDYIELINADKNNTSPNPLIVYAMSRIYMGNGMNDKAIEMLLSRPLSGEYYPFHYLDYLTGLAKLQRLDEDADIYFKKYLAGFEGINYIKAAYQKIAWHHLMFLSVGKYKEYISKVENHGDDIIDADKQAEREAEKDEVPNPVLLKARVAFDGGYYELTLTELTGTQRDFLSTPKDSLEYYYRIGRVYDGMDKPKQAIAYYKMTIENGSNSEYYYAANAALKTGIIYEQQGDNKQAANYYRKAMNMENEEYKNSIDQKAKAGLNRVEND